MSLQITRINLIINMETPTFIALLAKANQNQHQPAKGNLRAGLQMYLCELLKLFNILYSMLELLERQPNPDKIRNWNLQSTNRVLKYYAAL